MYSRGETTSILDSSLIVATKEVYDIKIVECGYYCQVYIYSDKKAKSFHKNMLYNININDTTLIYSQENNMKFKHIKY